MKAPPAKSVAPCSLLACTLPLACKSTAEICGGAPAWCAARHIREASHELET